MDLYFWRLDKKTELSIAQQDFFFACYSSVNRPSPIYCIVGRVFRHIIHIIILYIYANIKYINMMYSTDNIFRDCCAFIAWCYGYPFLLFLDNSSEIHNTGLFLFARIHLHVDPWCKSPTCISPSIIFDIPHSILKVLLFRASSPHHFF